MITKFKGSKAWNAYMAYKGFVMYLSRSDTMQAKGLYEYEPCLEYFGQLEDDQKKVIIGEVLRYHRIDHYDMLALVSIHSDNNGMSIDISNIDNFELPELAKMCIETFLHCSKFKDAGLFF
ncbi:hypothetical protein ACP6H1_21725 [Vibrio harveyi]|uniref:hypothetical protein n=1 Tax=Vibrio harveyi TaxID=669 RepID=UPI003CF29B05